DPRTKQPFWLDTINREVWVEGACHSLTPREYLILQYMWERPNRLCGHNELAAVVDGLEVVEVVNIDWLIPAVSRLRRKIEPDSENPKYIHTIRGQGYKLIVPKA
ncbi:MAG: winged helix-turn-helix transcriptional regulator, partial [Caldilineaceae bacterium]|nr:winged helix-turn-helix transcriptional regulator [Caldilineaceae bacterium]